MSDNLKVWNQVCKTDPNYTKGFQRGGGFRGTSANATWLARRATEMFGLMGVGWGMRVDQEQIIEGHMLKDGSTAKLHVVRATLWYMQDGKRAEVTHYGQTMLVSENKYGTTMDEDAPKKSLTDAMTKCLSMLGFAADIFLGMYDDNKYVRQVQKEFDAEREFDPQVAYDRCVTELAERVGIEKAKPRIDEWIKDGCKGKPTKNDYKEIWLAIRAGQLDEHADDDPLLNKTKDNE